MAKTYHRCMECGEFTPEDESQYMGSNERELWLCPICDNKPSVATVTPENEGLLRSGLVSLSINTPNKANELDE